MKRKMRLPAGWYPHSTEGIDRYLYIDEKGGLGRAAVAPHAGWFFSGKIAAKALSSLNRNADTVVIAGGHLPAGYPALFAEEDAVCTPLGDMLIDDELRALVKKEFFRAGLNCAADNYTDNTVETLLPAVHRLFPAARLLWLRLGADLRAYAAGSLIARAVAHLNRNAVLVGSTDLTHYGPDYDFCPKGLGKEALDWVKSVNDKRFIDAVVSGDRDAVITRTVKEHSACSPGGVLCAMAFGAYSHAEPPGGAGEKPAAKLLAYASSADALDAPSSRGEARRDSFVGYAAIAML
jgi:AmmeMemoRadiSam system protein B